MIFKNFLKIVEVAKDNGYRETYLKKINVIFLQKDNLFFNMSGIYTYKKGRFILLCNFVKEKLTKQKILEKLGIEKR